MLNSTHPAAALFDDVEQLSVDECLALLTRSGFGRMVLSVSALPVAVPVSFALGHNELLLSVSPGQAYEAARNTVIALEADEQIPEDGGAWSVVVQGRAAGPEPTSTDHILHLPLSRVSGWRRQPHRAR